MIKEQYYDSVYELQILEIPSINTKIIKQINTFRFQGASLSKFEDILAKINRILGENETDNQNVYLTSDLSPPPLTLLSKEALMTYWYWF